MTADELQSAVKPTNVRHRVFALAFATSSLLYLHRYVFAFIERSTLSARFRVNYAFTPNFTVEAYAEPFAASGRFYDHGELPAPRSRTLRTYGAPGTGTTITKDTAGVSTVTDGAVSFKIPALDFNQLSFRSNLVLRWEWLPGSTAYLIWQQSRQDRTPTGQLINASDVWNSTQVPGDNFFVMKVSYWLGVN
jgi:hypothetical protein